MSLNVPWTSINWCEAELVNGFVGWEVLRRLYLFSRSITVFVIQVGVYQIVGSVFSARWLLKWGMGEFFRWVQVLGTREKKEEGFCQFGSFFKNWVLPSFYPIWINFPRTGCVIVGEGKKKWIKLQFLNKKEHEKWAWKKAIKPSPPSGPKSSTYSSPFFPTLPHSSIPTYLHLIWFVTYV